MANLVQKIKKNKRDRRKKKFSDTEKLNILLSECDCYDDASCGCCIDYYHNDDDFGNENDDINNSVEVSIKLWNDIKKRVAGDETFIKMSDIDKICLYQNSEFKTFYTEFPIVSRYMICMGQFSETALRRFLYKCKNVNHDKDKSREKGYSENQWIERQSDYVRYLWESYQNKKFMHSESNEIWKNTFEILKKEFQDFKDLHKEIENKLKKDDTVNKEELIKELLNRVVNDKQSFDDTTAKHLLDGLKEQVIKQRRKKLLVEIISMVTTIAPTREAIGCRNELKESKSSTNTPS
jgi:hypothetical protein